MLNESIVGKWRVGTTSESIDIKRDGTFSLKLSASSFTGKWSVTSDAGMAGHITLVSNDFGASRLVRVMMTGRDFMEFDMQFFDKRYFTRVST